MCATVFSVTYDKTFRMLETVYTPIRIQHQTYYHAKDDSCFKFILIAGKLTDIGNEMSA